MSSLSRSEALTRLGVVQRRVAERLASGASLDEAARAGGVPEDTVLEWLDTSLEFQAVVALPDDQQLRQLEFETAVQLGQPVTMRQTWVTEGPEKTISISWYRPADYPKLKRLMADGHRLPATYPEWARKTAKVLKEYERQGIAVHKAVIDPIGFPAFCRARGLALDAQARVAWALHLIENPSANAAVAG